MSKLKDAYRLLGLPYGASMDDVKKARRNLARQWHPDIYPKEQERQLAENRIKQINAAFAYIKKVKSYSVRTREYSRTSHQRTSYNQKKKPTGQKQRYEQNSSSEARQGKSGKKKEKTSQKYKKRDDSTSKQPNKDETKGWWSRYKKRQEQKRKARRQQEINRMTEQRNADLSEFERSYRIGFRRSWLNNLLANLFAISDTETEKSKEGGITFFSSQRKQMHDLTYTLMKDDLFYTINSGINIILKFALGFLLGYEFLKNVNVNYFHGVFYGNFQSFIWSEVFILLLLTFLFIPDNLFQRYLLWKYRNASHQKAKTLFSDGTLPGRFENTKTHILLAKYALIAFMLWMYY